MVRRARSGKTVSASALSQMGVCERLVVFEHRDGKRPTPAQKAALRRGVRVHCGFAIEALSQGASSDEPRAGRCFIATHVFGEGPETRLLRRFRDRFLRHGRTGRLLIVAYYRVAPKVCRVMDGRPLVRIAVRALMRPLLWLVELLPGMQGADRVD
jgi:hypothetical protein